MSTEKFYQGKKVLITGHTGFKGTWMCCMLQFFGAQVTGYALQPPTNPSLFVISDMGEWVDSVVGDVRNFEHLMKTFDEVKPEIVIHMAAQPLVRESYQRPVYTYETNVMGTVHVLECIRRTSSVKSFVNVTTDKVYKNREWVWGYRENEQLNGYDPYSNSKSCSELVTDSYCNSFWGDRDIAVSTVRAGNVIGGGDFAKDRIIPDCVNAASRGEKILVRKPYSIRPYQHVLEPVYAYILLAKEQYKDQAKADCYNVGPEEDDCCATGELVELFCRKWKEGFGVDVGWVSGLDSGPHEADYLKLDCSKIKSRLQWRPKWGIEMAMEKVIQWNKVYVAGENMRKCMETQISDYMR